MPSYLAPGLWGQLFIAIAYRASYTIEGAAWEEKSKLNTNLHLHNLLV